LGDINETPKKTNKLIYGFAYMIHNMGTGVSSIGALVGTVLPGLHLGMFHLACRLTRIYLIRVSHFIVLDYQGKDILFRFIIEYSSLRDFGPSVIGLLLYEDF
jgi:hypothetical protein